MLSHDVTDQLESLLEERILILDGAAGTQIQALGLEEADVRGDRFPEHHKDLKNFGDLLCLTQPDAILDIHRSYLAAGADIIETCTFNASPVGMADFELPAGIDREINLAAVALAKQACEEFNEKTVCCWFDWADCQTDGYLDQCRRSCLAGDHLHRDG